MTVFSKKATIRFENENKSTPTREIDVFLNSEKFRGINCIILKNKAAFQNEIDVEFVCSNVDPANPKSMEDIDKLLSNLNVAAELGHHKNDPLNKNNHLYEIMTNLDNPNIPDKLKSKAKLKHEEILSKEDVKSINEDFEQRNKKLSDTSTDNSERLKTLDERKTKFEIGEIERE